MSEPVSEMDVIGEAYRHCEQLVRVHDKDRFLASLYAPAERRSYLFALYAFALEIGRVQLAVKEPTVGTIRLQWWHEAIGGSRAEEAAASPVMIALQDAAHKTGVSLASLVGAVEARQAELYGEPAIGAASAVFLMAVNFLGVDGETFRAVADSAAIAVTFVVDPRAPEKASSGYAAFYAQAASLPERVLPAFLPVAVVPLLLRQPAAGPWRRQIALLRAAWFGFPKL